MTDYSKSTIYKIACKDPNIEEIYIGSTCNFIKRRWQHKSICNNPNDKHYNQYVYQFIREHGGWENWDVYIIEKFSCTSKMQKEQVERGWVEELKSTLNKNVPANHQTGDVLDKIKQAKRKQYEMDKDKTLERVKAYSESHKVEIHEYIQRTVHCPYCNHHINLANRAQHNRTTIHITNSESSSEPDTIMDEMNKMHDDNLLKLHEIQHTFETIDKMIY